MEYKDEFEKLVMDGKNCLPFIETLNKEQQKALVPKIKKLNKYLSEFIEKGNRTYGSRGDTKQLESIGFAGYRLMNYTDYTKAFWTLPIGLFENNYYKEYRPEWFGKYINENLDSIWKINYNHVIELYQNKWLEPSKELVVLKLLNTIYIDTDVNRQYAFSLKNLYLDAITLKEHIWYLFELDNNIHYSNRFVHLQGKHLGWEDVFVQLIEKNDLDRIKVLKESFLTATRNFNKIQSGWYFKLIELLNPTEAELLTLQDELFLSFNSPQSKPINVSLSLVKKIVKNQQFNIQQFLDHTPVLLTSEVKSIVKSTLVILDALVKNNKAFTQNICTAATNALLSQDDDIQKRAATIIEKYGDKDDVDLKEQLEIYTGSLFINAKDILKDFISQSPGQGELSMSLELVKTKKISETNKIIPFKNNEDRIFFLSQCFENNEPYHFDLFLKTLPELMLNINKDDITKLEPTLKRALTKTNIWDMAGKAEYLMAITFLNVAYPLMEAYPNESKALLKLYTNALKIESQNKYKTSSGTSFCPIERIDADPIVAIYKPLLNYCKNLISNKVNLPFLSTPTYTPCWLDIETFINRLTLYQKQDKAIEILDFQIAISRLVIDGQNDFPENTLNKEYNNLLSHLFGKTDFNIKEVETPEIWIPVLYRKNNLENMELFLKHFSKSSLDRYLIDTISWENKVKDEKSKIYNYKNREYEETVFKSKRLEFTIAGKQPKSDNILKNVEQSLLKKWIKKKTLYYVPLFLNPKSNMYNFDRSVSIDYEKMLYMAPNNADLIYFQFLKDYLYQTSYTEADEEKAVNSMLSATTHIWNNTMGEMAYLNLACCMLFSKKQGAYLAGEIWIRAVQNDNIDNKKLGYIFGKLQETEYAPMKRFTDLIVDQLFNASKKHNMALFSLLENMVPQLSETPIRGTKKILEIYNELLMGLNAKNNKLVLIKLNQWKSISSLKKVIGQIEK
ncbi:MAG: DUF6493 family protein [Aestuariibaculum sp.]